MARDPAKVEDQVRFLARTLVINIEYFRIDDAEAQRLGDRLQSSLSWVRLPPASLPCRLLDRVPSTVN